MVVQEQLYTYLLNTYDDADLSFSSYEKSELASHLAYDGDWQAYFGYIADCLHRYASQRDKQKGESFVHGFTLAMTAQNRFYRPISEQDTQAGYVDIFLCPMLDIYSDMTHSYIVELKYATSCTRLWLYIKVWKCGCAKKLFNQPLWIRYHSEMKCIA